MKEEFKIKGIRMFTRNVIRLISLGREESVSDIKNHIDNDDVADYILKKYSADLAVCPDEVSFNMQGINAFFNSFSDRFDCGETEGKLAVAGDNNGLLVLLSLVAELIDEK